MVMAIPGVLKRIRAERAGIVIPLPWSKACWSAEPPLFRESGLVWQGVQFGWGASFCLPVGPSSRGPVGERGGFGAWALEQIRRGRPLLPVR